MRDEEWTVCGVQPQRGEARRQRRPDRLPRRQPPVVTSARWSVLLVLLAAPFMAVLDAFVVIIAVPSMQDQLHASDAAVQLIVTGYVVAYAGGLVVAGRLGDAYGRRRLLVMGLSLFAGMSLLAAAAPNQIALVVIRFLQGSAAALMYPQAIACLRVEYGAGPGLARAMGIWGIALGIASTAAQVIGALLIQADIGGLGWRAVFAINVPIGLVAAVLVRHWVPESRAERPVAIDHFSVVTLVGGLLGLVLPLTVGRQMGWPAWTWPALLAAVALGVLFVVRERRMARPGAAPLIEFDAFRQSALAAGVATTVALYGSQLSLWMLLTLYLQHGLHLPPVATGMVTLPVGLGFLVSSAIVSRLAHPTPHPITAGAGAVAAGTGGLGVVVLVGGERPAVVFILPFLALAGAGLGMAIPSLAAALLAVVPRGEEGLVSGVLLTTQQIAGAVGVALSGVLLFGLLPRMPYRTAVGVTLVFNVVLFGLAALLGRSVRR